MRVKRFIEPLAVMIALRVMIVASSSATPREARQWQPLRITEFKDVAGTWEGVLVRNPRTRKDDWLSLTIRESGAYEFASPRTIGVFAGKGKLSLANGKLDARSEEGGQFTLQLFRDLSGDRRMLKADGIDSGGFTYTAELNRVRAG